MIYYDVTLTNTKEKVLVTADEVIEIVEKKKQGLEFIHIRDIFLNPKYIVSITPNYNYGASGPGVEPENPIRVPDKNLIAKLEEMKQKQLN